MIDAAPQIRQRADYTHKFNRNMGRHGWLRLTPAYSVKIVDEILDDAPEGARILDPFCGTATTALCAGYHGLDAATVEINPFLVWFGQVKTARYSDHIVSQTREMGERIEKRVSRGDVQPVPPPNIHNIERWWNPRALRHLCALKAAIDAESHGRSKSRDLLLVAFCRTLIDLSNAAFNHQSMSFNDAPSDDLFAGQDAFVDDYSGAFAADLEFILDSAAWNPKKSPMVKGGDSRAIDTVFEGDINNLFDLVVTSPPYPNRISYIRELRPYMYWLDYLKEAREAGELDWQAIGGTWGAATSRLLEWKRNGGSAAFPKYFDAMLAQVADAHAKNGPLLANYIAKYFEDIWKHLAALRKILSPHARLHYIVGNSTFYDILIPVEQLYADVFRALDYDSIETKTIRKRNSKKELFEYCVSATCGA